MILFLPFSYLYVKKEISSFLYYIYYFYALLFCILILTKNLIKLVEIATFCKMNSTDISEVVPDKVICSQQLPEPERTRSQLVSALSDAMFVSPGVHSAGTFARRRNNTFFFQFSHQTKSGMYAEVTLRVS